MGAFDSIASTIQNPFHAGVNPSMGNDFPDGFFMNEYVNGKINAATSLKLIGNQMPFQPFDWGGSQRLVKNYYPGNPEPAVHVLGAKEDNLKIVGRFKDKKYKDTNLYGVSYKFVELVDQMRIRGNLIQFGMKGTTGNWIRYGMIEDCKWKMNKLSWIDYEIDFLVIGFTKPVNNYFSTPTKTNPGDLNNALIAAANKANADFGKAPSSVPQSIAGFLNSITSAVASKINLVTGFISLVLNTAQSVEDSVTRALGLITNLKTYLYGIQKQFNSLTHAFNKNSPAGSSASPASQAANTYKNIAYTSEMNANFNAIHAYLAGLTAQLNAIKATHPKGRYSVVAGDTLQNISVRLYGISDNWIDIYKHNNLTTTALTPGQILEIPSV